MLVWRLVKPEFAPGLDGVGARRVGGRWNSPGQAMVYCTSSLALAALEYFVHVPPTMRQADRMPPLRAVGLTLLASAGIEYFPFRFGARFPDIEDSRSFGDDWLATHRTVALSVPSRVVPFEQNILLNPAHVGMVSVEVTEQFDFDFDSRLGQG